MLLPSLNLPPPSAPAADALQRWLRSAVGSVTVFVITGLLFSWTLDTLLPPTAVGDVSQKLASYADRQNSFDTLFVGSSRVYRQISPTVFDAQVQASSGQAVHSFNLGVPSMYLPESLFVVDWVLAHHPRPPLRRMFIELDEPVLRRDEHAGLLRREVYWHTPQTTALMVADILAAHGIRWFDRVQMIGHQCDLLLRRYAHLGRGWEELARWCRPTTPISEGQGAEDALLGPARDGFAPYRATLGDGPVNHKGDRTDVQRYLTAIAALRSNPDLRSRTQRSLPFLRWALQSRVARLRAHGIETIFVIAPVTTDQSAFHRLPAEGVTAPLLAFDDPTAYPELYEVAVRADTIHLNEQGSLRFTRLLAERFCAVMAPDHLFLPATQTAPSHAVR